jgi:hypothetical protein
MIWYRKIYTLLYAFISAVFVACALGLIVFAVSDLGRGLNPSSAATSRERFNMVIESVGVLTIAVAALELSQMVLEEEVLRTAHMSAPTRVRRFLSRFMVVIIVSLSIEFLVAVFTLLHVDPSKLPQAASIGVAAALMLAAWGVFVRFNRSAEELEPEAMAQAKREDKKLE